MEVLTDLGFVEIVEESFLTKFCLPVGKTAVFSPSTFPLEVEILANFSLILLTLSKIPKVLMVVVREHVIRKRITAETHASIGLGVYGFGTLAFTSTTFLMKI